MATMRLNDMVSDILLDASADAGLAILDVASKGIQADKKTDQSPVTEADRRGEEIILAALSANFPDIPVVAEEAASEGHLPDLGDEPFFLVDPLDGTKEFIKGRQDYTVNIALIDKGRPVAGIVLAPARQTAWVGVCQSEASQWAQKHALDDRLRSRSFEAIQVRSFQTPPSIVASLSHMTQETSDFVSRFDGCDTVNIGSSLKFCLLAEGGCDLYPRFGPTMQWDTAAGDAVLRAAGGMTWRQDGQPLRYGDLAESNKPFLNPFFIAACRKTAPPHLGFAGSAGR